MASLRVHRDKLDALGQDITMYVSYATKMNDYLMKKSDWSKAAGKSLYNSYDYEDRDYKERNYIEKIRNDYETKNDVLIDTMVKGKLNDEGTNFMIDMNHLSSIIDDINEKWDQLFS